MRRHHFRKAFRSQQQERPKRRSKAEIRAELDAAMEQFLANGGAVDEVPRGASGLENGRYNDRSLGFEKPSEPRTPVDDVMQAIDQRKGQPKNASPQTSKPSQPKQKIIYDDFGEPLRVVWEE